MIENVRKCFLYFSERSERRFGVIAITLLVTTVLIAGMIAISKPG